MSSHARPPPVRACLFDMDGLLIDSEDLYTICTNEVLREYGKPDLPWSIKAQLQGRPGPDSSRIFLEWAQLPCSINEFNAKTRALQAHYFPSTKPLPGAPSLLHTLSHKTPDPRIHIALATSSNSQNFLLKTKHLEADLFSFFPDERRVLGDDTRIPEGRGKPAPDIYLLAMKTINDGLRAEGRSEEELITPEECLVLEDSVPGVEAGRRAGMQVVWCPHPELLKEYKGREVEVLAGLTGAYKESLSPVVDAGVKTRGQRRLGAPGKVGDGWAVQLESLEDFPYERFGIKVEK